VDVRKRVVLIEDDAIDVKLISDCIARVCPESRLEVFRDGGNALGFFSRFRIEDLPPLALVLLDLKLPGLSGQELLSYIKGRDTTRNLPIVVVTGAASPDQIARLYEMGANSVIEKLRPDRAIEALERVLNYWVNQNITPERAAGS
jgi:CheY-like chemotaxis protein